MSARFRVGVSADFQTDGAGVLDPILAAQFGPLPAVEYEFMPQAMPEVRPDHIQAYDAMISLLPRYSAASLQGAARLAVIARWGVGYDMIDVQACTEYDVLLCITPDAVRRPMAVGIITLLLALTRRVVVKDGLVRRGRWIDKVHYPGIGLAGRTLGSTCASVGGPQVRSLRPVVCRA